MTKGILQGLSGGTSRIIIDVKLIENRFYVPNYEDLLPGETNKIKYIVATNRELDLKVCTIK